ncbi:MAG: hypothetical protein A2104_02415 [Candidatus Melainabacteria bacterium GWF2_32_7]|nr:MAG: hypothetical protein A2104_02415 [Candidatus Melainabacteria bacterium GWF2_32_7]
MYKSLFKSNQINSKDVDNQVDSTNNIIFDKACPRCNKLIVTNKDYCACGFYLKAFNNSIFWTSVLSACFFIGFILIIGLVGLNSVRNYASHKLQNKLDFNSLSPINIQIISSLKRSPYDGYIQNIYVKPKEENKLMILIKPNLWHTLNKKEKENLVKQVSENWKIIYKRNNPDSTKESLVKFANFN